MPDIAALHLPFINNRHKTANELFKSIEQMLWTRKIDSYRVKTIDIKSSHNGIEKQKCVAFITLFNENQHTEFAERFNGVLNLQNAPIALQMSWSTKKSYRVNPESIAWCHPSFKTASETDNWEDELEQQKKAAAEQRDNNALKSKLQNILERAKVLASEKAEKESSDLKIKTENVTLVKKNEELRKKIESVRRELEEKTRTSDIIKKRS